MTAITDLIAARLPENDGEREAALIARTRDHAIGECQFALRTAADVVEKQFGSEVASELARGYRAAARLLEGLRAV